MSTESRGWWAVRGFDVLASGHTVLPRFSEGLVMLAGVTGAIPVDPYGEAQVLAPTEAEALAELWRAFPEMTIIERGDR